MKEIYNLSILPEGGILTEKDMALLFKVTERTIRNMVNRTELPPPVKMGRFKVWFADRVRIWIEETAKFEEKQAHALRKKILGYERAA